MLDWDDLRTFLAIARNGSLSAAARALGVRQSTVGRRLAGLEAGAGARLLHKTPGGYVLTAAGEAVLGNVERIEAEALAVERAISGKDVRLEGEVRVTTVETLAATVLMSAFASFQARYPGIGLELLAGTRTLSLARREADVALRLARLTQADLVVRKLATIGCAIYASPDYLARAGRPDFGAEAAGHRVILTHDDLADLPEMRWFRGTTGRAAIALRTNSRYAMRAAAEAGMGLACLMRYLGDPAVEGGGLVRLPSPSSPPERELWLGVHQDTRHMPRIRAFIDHVTEALAAEAVRLNPD